MIKKTAEKYGHTIVTPFNPVRCKKNERRFCERERKDTLFIQFVTVISDYAPVIKEVFLMVFFHLM